MKKQILTAIILLVTISAFAQKKEKIKGNREVTTVIYELDSFTTLVVNEELEVTLINGSTPQVEISTDENLHEVFNVNVVNGTLTISTSKEIRSSKKLEIFVTISEDLERIHAEGDAELKSLTTLNIKKVEINAMGSSKLDLRIKSDSLAINGYRNSKHQYQINTRELIVTAFEDSKIKANVTATKVTSQVEFGEVKLQGQTDVLYLEVKEKGEFIAPTFKTREVSVTSTEQAKVVVNVTEKITIDAHDNSEIELLGSPASIIMYKFEGEALLRKIDENKKGFLKRIF
ncbi:hypothetical protein IMCC3317_04160 [Kordia antarctica]|uniref:Putative auto-transporter adhesin head GIN domain-containing protein n=1 Tax=Kordia antarctica TaxID=1218801 RepID=A0A7L4ZEY9_9FLAO|nr:DUF2807 domain-containing protein [Kordia antarctica]QHI35070.1 hypothetical protein IMCC3317_04160 [Kordia antarctica]